MNTGPLRFLLCLLAMALIAGCGSTRGPAPVRDAGKQTQRAASKPPAPRLVPAGHYLIQSGDTLYKVAFENSLDYRDLAAWNALADPDKIRAGDLLRLQPPPPSVKTNPLPTSARYTERPLETPLDKPAANPKPVVQGNAPASVVSQKPEAFSGDADGWAWPAQGALLAGFEEAGNKGIDIAGSLGAPVHAAAPGRVVYAGDGLRGYGKLIIIKHNQTMLSAYAHHSRVLVKEGQQVSRGQKIGEMGDSDADRVKLHFEIRMHGQPVDPMKYLPKAG